MRKDPRQRYSATPAFVWPDPAIAPFRGLMPRRVRSHLGFIQHELRVGDRLDRLAGDYYGDPRFWWVIAEANPDIFFPADLSDARSLSSFTGKLLSLRMSIISCPTAPVAPAIATL